MNDKIQDDSGQTSVFIVGVTVVLLLFTLTLAAITSVTLQHRKLLSLADSAAQRAATGFIIDDPQELTLTLTQPTAHAQVVEHFADVNAPQQFPNLSIVSVAVDGNSTVTVELSATAHPPVVNWIIPAGVPVLAEGSARTQLTP